MFAYLALQQGRLVQRNQLTILFWDGYSSTRTAPLLAPKLEAARVSDETMRHSFLTAFVSHQGRCAAHVDNASHCPKSE